MRIWWSGLPLTRTQAITKKRSQAGSNQKDEAKTVIRLMVVGFEESHSCRDQRITAERMINSYWEISQKIINFSLPLKELSIKPIVLLSNSSLRSATISLFENQGWI